MSEEINGWKPPVIHDLGNDRTRIVTQEDVDQLVDIRDRFWRLQAVHRSMGEVITGRARP